jgi:hypothetical protein
MIVTRAIDRKDATCMPSGLPNVVMARTVMINIDSHPQDRSLDVSIAVARAVMTAFPCIK